MREKDEIRLDTAFSRIRIGVSILGLFVLSITVRVVQNFASLELGSEVFQ